jgi:hypothetical protein
MLSLAATEDDSMAERTARLVEKHLNAVEREYDAGIRLPTDHSGLSCSPSVV